MALKHDGGVRLVYSNGQHSRDPHDNPCLIIGQYNYLKALKYEDVAKKFGDRVDQKTFYEGIELCTRCSTVNLWLNYVKMAVLPPAGSRHNSPCSPHFLPTLIHRGLLHSENEDIVIICRKADAFALACAVARCYPTFNRKYRGSVIDRTVTVEFCITDDRTAVLTSEDIAVMDAAACGIRTACYIVDAPCNMMQTTHFVEEAKRIAKLLKVKSLIIEGEDLKAGGFGGIYGVGQAASAPPALVVLSHTPRNATKTFAWVGKGIVYDTGGLCIKTKTGMPGMKRDCGGAAAILGAFYAAVSQGFSQNLHAILCLAENAVGPKATRPDDIHTMYSGYTVEINNTDAEGRLVLSDGVHYALKNLKADVILDMATLTGAQAIATGLYHAAVLTNQESWETAATAAGRSSGDLVHPVPYAPELHFPEFSSSVADMLNSVLNRGNAQVSCAGLFIGKHIGWDYKGAWIHVDMAAPAHSGERATGYGVALLLVLFGFASHNPLLQSLSKQMQ
ncbi:putative aminopeptidase NPEPL1 [Trichoplax sp. H2]|uniref:Cytosol aminopeptidase domain-containing protein n=1 Tax=Trichoplax adhaerens TaxID=10228 RepID=B3RJ17_TRIAD|nr:hypothetical protein TRIADDRAFT_37059 [Trichoplax adhaerens]EDV29043.1 hypothetical protein TRIADDRAFT_37059 [Trichoplax adhaerens]RDD47150.1 putative aminopeptidase NPEPL1 [Trichoplax sp. H2]|eukprot:XP_002108245.1 hypothetical protein TRIADDRAFT_37059 [Trichoplax adhaerens]